MPMRTTEARVVDDADKVWWIIRVGEREGPLGRAELGQLAAAGRLQRGDRLWKPGLATPVRAGTLAGLAWPVDGDGGGHAAGPWWRPWLRIWRHPWQTLAALPRRGQFALPAVLLASVANSLSHVANTEPGAPMEMLASPLLTLPVLLVLTLLALEIQLAVMLPMARWLGSNASRAGFRLSLYAACFPQALGLPWWTLVALVTLAAPALGWPAPGLHAVLMTWMPLHALLNAWSLLVMVYFSARELGFTLLKTSALVAAGVIVVTVLSWALGFAGATAVGIWQVTPARYRALLALATLAVTARVAWRWRNWTEV